MENEYNNANIDHLVSPHSKRDSTPILSELSSESKDFSEEVLFIPKDVDKQFSLKNYYSNPAVPQASPAEDNSVEIIEPEY